MRTRQQIPTRLTVPGELTLEWLNKKLQSNFEWTGLAEPIYNESVKKDSPFRLNMILCDGEICIRKDILVSRQKNDWSFLLLEEENNEIPPLLDPPSGHYRSWFEKTLAQHEFVLLLFYRGRW
tara:strand:- start:460 stop:828 length:369 start_codon:yes stop_codon:yes gene_type:complete